MAAWEVEGGSLRESGSGVEVVDAADVARIRVTVPEAFAARESGWREAAHEGGLD